MATKMIISYDGTNNEDDALALGRLFAQAGAEVTLAYVRHAREEEPGRERLARDEAQDLLERGARLLGDEGVERHVVEDRSTPLGLQGLAMQTDAQAVVFCSDSHTAPGSVSIGNSARRLLEGGTLAVAIAPAGLAGAGDLEVDEIAAVGEGADAAVTATAHSLADALDASVLAEAQPGGATQVGLLVLGARPEARHGTLVLSAAAENLVEQARCPVLMVPRGAPLTFSGVATLAV
jgi:nucleotide-binding universal stress UspA family protein